MDTVQALRGTRSRFDIENDGFEGFLDHNVTNNDTAGNVM